jgi:hypothetical protein
MNILQSTFILAFLCQICVAINPDVVQITHRVEQLERKVMHLGIIFNQTISSLETEVANLNTAIKVAQNNTALVRINFKSMSKLEFCPFLNIPCFHFQSVQLLRTDLTSRKIRLSPSTCQLCIDDRHIL